MKKNILFYLSGCFLSFSCFYFLADMHHASSGVPLYYSRDKDFTATHTIFWNFAETGSSTIASRLGAPDTSDIRRFPIDAIDRFDWWLIKSLRLWKTDYPFLLNTYFFLTFLSSTLTSMVVFRYLNFSRLASLSGALLFAFQPFHWFRSIGHIFIASYYLVPFLGLITLWLADYGGKVLFWSSFEPTDAYKNSFWKRLISVHFRPINYQSLFALIVVVLGSGTGMMYYLLMAIILWFFLVLKVASKSQRYNRLYDFATLMILSCIFCGAQLAPSIRYLWLNKIPNIQRSASGVAENSLDLFWLFLPSIGHRSDFLRKFVTYGSHYNSPVDHIIYPLGEKCFSSLGIIGAIGLLMILACALMRFPDKGRLRIFGSLTSITLIGIFISMSGGINRLFIYIPGFPIRGWARFSIFIAFFSLCAIISVYEEIRDRAEQKSYEKGKRLIAVSLVLLTCFGIWDQSPSIWIPNHRDDAIRWNEDKKFISALEIHLPRNSMIFNLPAATYPEGVTHTKSHLVSKHLRWSFGAYEESGYSSPSANWRNKTLLLPPEEFINELKSKGFVGILIEDDPDKSFLMKLAEKQRLDSLDFFFRFRLNELIALEKLELGIQIIGLHPKYVNDRGDWRFYSIEY